MPKKLRDNETGAFANDQLSVDEENRVVRGYIVAEAGPFKSKGRGEFDGSALKAIVALMKQSPTKVRFGHPDLMNNGLDSFIGWAKNPRLEGDKVRADLHVSSVAMMPLRGPVSLGEYVLERSKTDPASFGSSLVLEADKNWRYDKHKKPKTDEMGELLPPLWSPTAIYGSDIVDVGDAVHSGFCSAELSAELLSKAEEEFERERLEVAEELESPPPPKQYVGTSKTVAELRATLAERRAMG